MKDVNKKSLISTVSGKEVQVLIKKLDRISTLLQREHVISHEKDNSNDVELLSLEDLSAFQPQKSQSSTQQRPPKHLKQVESIYGHIMQSLDSYFHDTGKEKDKHDIIYCEMGCGTSKLSDYINEKSEGKSSHILIDRKSDFSKTKMRDFAMKARIGRINNDDPDQKPIIKRLVVDIQEIETLVPYLTSSCPSLSQHSDQLNCIVISKHLCGPAADFTINCCLPCNNTPPLVIATCCHYLLACQSPSAMVWENYYASFFSSLGLDKRDFEVMNIISQWASISIPKKTKSYDQAIDASQNNGSNQLQEEPKKNTSLPLSGIPNLINLQDKISSKQKIPLDLTKEEKSEFIPSAEFEKAFTKEEKMRLGKRCKIMIDLARAHRLQVSGKYRQVKLIRYTTMSMEDHLLIAVP